MRFTLTIDSDNDAFANLDGCPGEVAHILRVLARGIENGKTGEIPCHDANGNRVGVATFEPGDNA